MGGYWSILNASQSMSLYSNQQTKTLQREGNEPSSDTLSHESLYPFRKSTYPNNNAPTPLPKAIHIISLPRRYNRGHIRKKHCPATTPR